MDDVRMRFLKDRVLTATPAQRVVLLYDRLALDLSRARVAETSGVPGPHLAHAAQIVAELLGSLDQSTGEPATGLADLYHYLLGRLMSAQLTGDLAPLDSAESVVAGLREAWSAVADGTAGTPVVPDAALAGASWTA